MPDEPTKAATIEQPTPESKPEPTGQAPVQSKSEPAAEPPKITPDQIPEDVLREALTRKLKMEGMDPSMVDQFIDDAKGALTREIQAAQNQKAAEDAARKLGFEEQLAEAILRDQEKDARSGNFDQDQLNQRMLTRVIATLLGSTGRVVDSRIDTKLSSYRNQEREADKIFREHPELENFRAAIERDMQTNPPAGVMNFWLQRLEDMRAAGVTLPVRKPNLQAVSGGLSQSAYQSLTEPVGGQDNLDDNYAEVARERAEKLQAEKLSRMLAATEDY